MHWQGGKTKTGLSISCHFRVKNLLIGENSIMQVTLAGVWMGWLCSFWPIGLAGIVQLSHRAFRFFTDETKSWMCCPGNRTDSTGPIVEKWLLNQNKVLVEVSNCQYEGFEVFIAVTMKITVLWDVALCRSCENLHFGGMCHFCF
jgi:hypothetical protein